MRVMVIGSGGREHALAWLIARDPWVERVYVAPGNGGTMGGKLERIAAGTIDQWCAAAQHLNIDLTVVGPEAPLVEGIVDVFTAAKLTALGPSAAAARLEQSKSYAKDCMLKWGIPTAAYTVVDTMDQATDHFRRYQPPYVIKADGLAGGKGVEIADDRQIAKAKVAAFLAGKYGVASRRVVLEERLTGTEVSLMALCDGKQAIPLASSQDYKRLLDGDAGPNTGGMGAVSPAPAVAQGLVDPNQLCDRILMPLLAGLAEQGTIFRGFLYAGLMVSPTGEVFVLEFNCRLGDPEAQVVLPLWYDAITPALVAAACGTLQPELVRHTDQNAVGVVLVADGYPHQPRIGAAVTLPPCDANEFIFQAGTRRDDNGQLIVVGGRVACAIAVRDEVMMARQAAYTLADKVVFEGCQMRRDIAGT